MAADQTSGAGKVGMTDFKDAIPLIDTKKNSCIGNQRIGDHAKYCSGHLRMRMHSSI